MTHYSKSLGILNLFNWLTQLTGSTSNGSQRYKKNKPLITFHGFHRVGLAWAFYMMFHWIILWSKVFLLCNNPYSKSTWQRRGWEWCHVHSTLYLVILFFLLRPFFHIFMTLWSLRVGEITRKCGFVNQKIRGRRPSNFLIHEFTLSRGFSGLNHKKSPCENQCYIYVA